MSMTIAEMRERGKKALTGVPKDALVVGILLLSSSASFGLGLLAGRDSGEGGFAVSEIPLAPQAAPAAALDAISGNTAAPASLPAGGQVVVSKNGTKYYLPWCASANRISEANRVLFASKDAAEAAGYTPAANCPGL